jgi:2'-5' RNA ligase
MRDADGLRAFFALDLDAGARTAAAELARRLREGAGGEAVRWVRPEALHVTLRFLGNVAPARVAPLAERVGAEVAAVAPFELELGEAQLFPTPRRPRVVALALTPEAPLAALAAAVERGVVAAGCAAEERSFRAHLTLGRVAPRGRPPATRGLRAQVRWPVREVVLFRSELSPSGSKYTPLARLPLGAGGGATDHP